MELYIRGAQADDAQAIITLLLKLQTESTTFEVVEHLETISSAQLANSLVEIQNSTNALILVVVDEHDHLYGILTALPNRRSAQQTEIGIAVLNRVQGLGLGSALMEMVLDWFFEFSASQQLFLSVQVQNSRARHLYEKMNFKYIPDSNKQIVNSQGILVETIDMILEEK